VNGGCRCMANRIEKRRQSQVLDPVPSRGVGTTQRKSPKKHAVGRFGSNADLIGKKRNSRFPNQAQNFGPRSIGKNEIRRWGAS